MNFQPSPPSPKDTPVLVTGGTGMVGAYLLELLDQAGYRCIRAIYRPGTQPHSSARIKHTIQWVECDLLDPLTLEKTIREVEQIYHCAGLISFRKKDRKEMLRVNVEGTANLMNIALHAGIKKVLHVSSVAALGRTKPGQERDEKDHWERSPYNTFYGLSKYQGEQEAWRAHAEGLNLNVVNPSIILGAHDWYSGPGRFFPMLDRSFPFYPVGGTGLVDVRDVVHFMVQLMESDINGERYILNAGTLSYQAFFQKIAQALQVPPPRFKISRLLQQIAWRMSWLQETLTGKPSLITRETAAQSSYTYHYPADKSKAAFDFQYRNLDQSIQEMALAYQQWKNKEETVHLPFYQPEKA
jgi:nucleoside-diphosphate-sugar epimerase